MPVIAGNWKMHHDHLVAIQVVQKLSYRLDKADYEANDVVVCPPFTDLRTLQTLIDSDRLSIRLGAQNCHWEDQGAYTGEVSPLMLAKLNVQYVIVGHSERRQLFGETDEIGEPEAARRCMKHGMTPIVCVGETLEEREAGATAERVDSPDARRVRGREGGRRGRRACVAYEPIWAIGTGRNATPEDAERRPSASIRGALRDALRRRRPREAVRIQYGGSVKPGNVADLMAMPEIDGALVGGASLDPDEFARIVQYRR